MEPLHLIPNWFVNFHIIFQILFFAATALIAFYAFKVYELSKQKESRTLGFGFSFLSASYLVLAVINMIFVSVLTSTTRVVEIEDIMGLRNFAIYLYIGLNILGFITLFYTILKIKSKEIYLSLILLSAITMILTPSKTLGMYIITSLFLILITFSYFREYTRTKNRNTFFISVGMLFILMSSIGLGLSTNFILPEVYVISHLLMIVGYSSIIYSLVRIINHGQKKK